MEKSEGAGRVVEARLSWGGQLLAVGHRPADGASSLRDFGLPGLSDADLLVVRDGALLLPTGDPVPSGHALALRLGKATLRLAFVEDDAPLVPRVSRRRGIAVAAAIVAAMHVLVYGFCLERRDAEREVVKVARATTPPIAVDVGGLHEPTEVSEAPPAAPEVHTVDVPVPRRLVRDTPGSFGLVAIVATDGPRARSGFDRDLDVDAINRLFTPTIDATAAALATRTRL